MAFVLVFQLEQHYRFIVVYLKKRYHLKAGQKEALLIQFIPMQFLGICWNVFETGYNDIPWHFYLFSWMLQVHLHDYLINILSEQTKIHFANLYN